GRWARNRPSSSTSPPSRTTGTTRTKSGSRTTILPSALTGPRRCGRGCRLEKETGTTGSEPVVIARFYDADNPPQPRLAVLVVTLQTKDMLRDFLLSVRAEQARLAGMPVKVVVVDNVSTDGTAEMVRREFPDVRLIASSENGGPARAFNLGLAEVLPEADLVVISNSDVTIHAGTLGKMVEFLRNHPDVDGCCGRLYNSDGTPQVTRTRIWSLRRAPKDQPHRATFPGTTFAMFRAE